MAHTIRPSALIPCVACSLVGGGALVATMCLPAAAWWAPIASMIRGRIAIIAREAVSAEALAGVLGVGLVVAAEIPVLGYSKSSLHRLIHPTKSTGTDVVWFVVRTFGLGSLVVAIWSLGLTVAASRVVTRYVHWNLLGRIANRFLHVSLYLVVTDFLNYWVHRGRHRVAWWWELHKLHHSATEFNAITWARGHPLDDVVIFLVSAVPAAMLGGQASDSLWLLTLLAIHAGLTHSMLPWSWGWFGKYVLRSPLGHRIHHSALPEHRDRNFASIFPAWDWLFGTAYAGDVTNAEVGVDANYHNVRGLPYDLIETTRRAFRAMRRRGGVRQPRPPARRGPHTIEP